MQTKLLKIAQASSHILRVRSVLRKQAFYKKANIWDSFKSGFQQGYNTGQISMPQITSSAAVSTKPVKRTVKPAPSSAVYSGVPMDDPFDTENPANDPRLQQGEANVQIPSRPNRGKLPVEGVAYQADGVGIDNAPPLKQTPKYKSTIAWRKGTGYDLGDERSDAAYNAAQKEWTNLKKYWDTLDPNQQAANQAAFDKRKQQLQTFAKTHNAYRKSFQPTGGQPPMYAPNSPEGVGHAMGIQTQQRMRSMSNLDMQQNLQRMQQNQQAFMAQQKAKRQVASAPAMPRRRMVGGTLPATNNNLIMKDYV